MVSDFVVSEVRGTDGVHCSVLLCPLRRLFLGVELCGTSWLLSRTLCESSSSVISKCSSFSFNPWSSRLSFRLDCDSAEFAFRKCLFSAVSLPTSVFNFLLSYCRCLAQRSMFLVILRHSVMAWLSVHFWFCRRAKSPAICREDFVIFLQGSMIHCKEIYLCKSNSFIDKEIT